MVTTIRADQVGSLLRPPELLAARASFAEGRISAEEFRDAEDTAILTALELQRQAGVDVFTDGEYRRTTFLAPLSQGMEGLIKDPNMASATALRWQGPQAALANAVNAEASDLMQIVGGTVRATGRLTGGEGAFLSEHAPGPWKVAMPGAMLRANAMFRPGLTDKFYATPADLGADFAGMIADEVRALAAEGLSYFQLDSLLYVRPLPKDQVDASIATDNKALEAAHQAGVTVGLHMCRGNNRSSWLSEGSYEPNAERAFNELKADRFLLEYDTERAGGFEPLRFLPRGKTVVLGLISTKVPQLEKEESLLRRIEEASRFVPLENLAISPQCGFASSMWGNLLSWDDQRRKLELAATVAHKVWS